MRMFVAVTPSPEAIEDLDAFLDVRREAAAFRWTSPEQWHFTLAFMPDAPDRILDDLIDRLAATTGRRRPFSVRIRGGGAFPDVGGAKVLWCGLGMTEPGDLDQLATGCRAAAVKSGAAVDGGRFRAHLTLARMGRPVEASNWVRLLDAYSGPPWRVDRVALIQSHLGEGPRGRPRHELVESLPLGEGTSAVSGSQ